MENLPICERCNTNKFMVMEHGYCWCKRKTDDKFEICGWTSPKIYRTNYHTKYIKPLKKCLDCDELTTKRRCPKCKKKWDKAEQVKYRAERKLKKQMSKCA